MNFKRLTALLILAGLFLSGPSVLAQDRDEQMINASLRFIKENANLTKKEYEKFAKIYIEYNEQLVKLNRDLKPDSRDYMKRWQEINSDYMQKLNKSLPDSTRQKVGVAQWELGQKVWGERAEQTRQTTERQFRMMGQWNQMNPQFMMAPHIYDFQRMHQHEMQQADEQQQQWWENYWRNWGRPDSSVLRRMEENRRRWSNDSTRFNPQFNPMGRGMVPGQMPGQSFGAPGQNGWGRPQYGAPGQVNPYGGQSR
jgi:hypothetical protein